MKTTIRARFRAVVMRFWCRLFHRRYKWRDSSWPTHDTLQDLVGRSVAEATENNRRGRYNAAVATEAMILYDNTALCELVDAVDNVLTLNNSINEMECGND